ncbi:hypothetical protein M9Y10_033944 [Tritrichomonas musculus]|uniref:Uncharacterized protein n=1 Tax=Tritrichomonas musculus TaxID=1915356 RepID=A0ABR2KDK3_9EUKA
MSDDSILNSYFPIILKEFASPDQKFNALNKIFQCLEVDFQEWEFNDNELPFIASYLHKLYIIPSSNTRTTVLRICFQLELYSEDPICELYHFDYLIVTSLDQRNSSSNSKNDEKTACFEYILLLLKTEKPLPVSIVRTLISIYSEENSQYKTFILTILGQYSILTDEIDIIPEIGEIFIDSLVEGFDDGIFELIAYGFENRLPFLLNRHLINLLLSPISQIEESLYSCDKTCSILSQILSTWPGFFVFGLEMNGIENLVKCSSHKARYVIQIIKNLFIFNDTPNIITNPYCAFLIKILLHFDFLKETNLLSKDSSFVSFYTSLMPYLTKYANFNLPKIDKSSLQNSIKIGISDAFRQNNDYPINYDLQSYQLPPDPNQYDWKIIQMKIAIFMPSNENEIKNSASFYLTLLDYFCGPFLYSNQVTSNQIISDCFIDLIDFLIKKDWGMSLIQRSDSAKNAFKFTICQLLQNTPIDSQSPVWTFFKSISNLMSTHSGVNLLTKFELLDGLRRLGDLCSNLYVAERIISMIQFYPDGGWAIPVFDQFINSPNRSISSLSIKELKRKIETTQFQKDKLFSMLLVPHIKNIFNQKEYDRLKEPLGLLMELISKYDVCFKSIICDRQMHKILSICDHFVYAYILSDPESHEYSKIEDEINWWLTKGNEEYLNVYDKAMEYAFSKKESILVDNPSIITYENGFTLAPPHLFSQLPKSQKGFQLLSKYIGQIVKSIPDSPLTSQRASFFALANFASIPGETEKIIENENVVEVMIKTALKSDSYVLKGSLICCLSLFTITDSFSKILIENGFEMFVLGHQKTIVPIDFSIFLKKEVHFEETVIQIPQKSEVVPDEVAKRLIELLNPITSKEARDQLFTLYRGRSNGITTTDIALYAHQLMAHFTYTSEIRKFIFELFKQTPLYPRIEAKCDPEITAIVKAKFYILLNKSSIDKPSIINVELPKYSLSELSRRANEKYSQICTSVPEVYLTDEVFNQATKMDKKTFYSLTKNEQQKIRNDLLSMKS